MAKIKIEDLPKEMEISTKDMRAVWGGISFPFIRSVARAVGNFTGDVVSGIGDAFSGSSSSSSSSSSSGGGGGTKPSYASMESKDDS